MSSVDKALTLLRFFSTHLPEIGLSELARLSGHDKTTTLRCLTALKRNGFLEQDPTSRKYRVGLTPIHLAQIREHNFPVRTIIARHLEHLATTLEETAHGTLLMGDDPVAVSVRDPDRALYVRVEPSGVLPWNATASGLAISAFLPPERQAALLARPDPARFTDHTETDPDRLRAILARCRAEGLARAHATFENEVIGTAAPILDSAAAPVGAIAVAAVASRMTPELQGRIDRELRRAAAAITQDLGGPPAPTAKDRTHASDELP
ncbi:MAG: IclR family transcriptional regulator [Pseudomonadota bacterium]